MPIYGIPTPQNGMDAFNESFGLDNLMNQILNRNQQKQTGELERERRKQQEEQFMRQMALRERELGLQHQFDPLNRSMLEQQLIGLKQKNDPMHEINQFAALQNMLSGGGIPGQKTMQEVPTQEMGQGMGAFSPQGVNEIQSQNVPSPQGVSGINLEAMRNNPLLRGFFKQKFGMDPLAPIAETPEEKRALDFQDRIKLEDIKNKNKELDLKNKEIISVGKDLPTLEKSLKGVDELLRIAKENPDMFGHGFMPDRFAKTTKIKDFGKWQNLISDAIAGLEQKLSSRGNIVALKMAAQLKPSHAEQQPVAIGKLQSMREQLIDSINNSRKVLGKDPIESASQNESPHQYHDDDLVVVEGPNGKETMTYAKAKSLGAQ